jgi:glutamate-ammonia-ligase adenylyltransferase
MLEFLLSHVPEPLQQAVEYAWQDWVKACDRHELDPGKLVSGAAIDLPTLGRTWACSDFLARTCIRYPAAFQSLLTEGLDQQRTLADYRLRVQAVIDNSLDLDQRIDDVRLMKALRELRHLEMVRIAWRDLNQLAGIDIILQELTDCAEAMVAVTLQALEADHATVYGMPLDARGEPQSLLVYAMGKMGGGELNFSSDIDLIFTYADDGQTTGRRSTSHGEFYLAVIRKLVKVLDEQTVDGFVYRVDTRLRPFGQSGPLAMSFSGLEQYYQSHGRDWERYAMIKARLITGRAQDRKYLKSMLTPFVYRRYLDFTMIESIREMKSMINTQMQRKGMKHNIKLGRGGIREIEFIGQTLQLIRAGRDPELRERSIIRVLNLLAEKSFLQQQEAEQLIQAYWFLRKLENRLQMLGDRQTHSLPEDALQQQRICLAMDIADWPALLEQLAIYQKAVDDVFQHLIAAEEGAANRQASAFSVFWADADKHTPEDEAYRGVHRYLEERGYQDIDTLIRHITELRNSPAFRQLMGDSIRLMAQLVESLVEKIADYPNPVELFGRVARILKALAGRKVYISLLNEYQGTQLQMLTLCSTSEWFTERLVRYPILLDSLMASAEAFREQYDVRQLLELELKKIATESVEDDLELLMERMRQFKRQTEFTVAMLDVFYHEPVERVSDHLTELANVLLEKILQFAWRTMADKYGEPVCVIDGETHRPKMAIVAYGKLGGNELGYGSDLDIIFLHSSRGEKEYTDGDRQIDNSQFFARVAQRVIHFLNTRTYSGVLYEADTRLRPDGQAGLMVSSIGAFEHYQLEKAWTWEHQALIRARFVTGDALIGQEFDRIRASVLQKHRDNTVLLQEVADMREKMRTHLAGKADGFDLKQDRGGLVDIEFVTQAGTLLHAGNSPQCIQHTATLELIRELVGAGWYSEQDGQWLSEAYRCLRKLKNWQTLQCATDKLVSAEQISQHRSHVQKVWEHLMPQAKPSA